MEEKIWNIGEIAKHFNVATSLIRYWESEFDIIAPSKDKKGNRFYTEKDFKSVETVYHLVKVQAYTLEGAKKVLSERETETVEKVELISDLNEIKNSLQEIRKKFDKPGRR